MAFEAYEAICAGLANLRYPDTPTPDDTDLPYFPRRFQRTHKVCRWVGADRWHAQWTLAHADAAAKEHLYRYQQTTPILAWRKCHDYLHAHLHEFPSNYGPIEDYDPHLIEYYGAFNFDWFRWEESFRPGTPILDPAVSLRSRYRLSLLHKWLYLDERAVSFGRRGPPAWAFNPVLRRWITRTFGEPPRSTPELDRLRPRVRLQVPARPPVLPVRPWDVGDFTRDLWVSIHTERAEIAGVKRLVVFNSNSPANTHRYLLAAQWDARRPPLLVIMTNPSTADHLANDRTFNRVMAFARRWNYGGVVVVNVFSFRAREPEDVLAASQPIGQDNYVIIDSALTVLHQQFKRQARVLVAWGALAPKLAASTYPAAVKQVLKIVHRHGQPYCLALSKDGHPKHLLYVKGDVAPFPYEAPL